MIIIEKRLRTRPAVASFDLEWTKNYRIRNGNRPFCFSLVTLAPRANPEALARTGAIGVYSAYIEREDETADLLREADRVLREVLQPECVLVGHQLSSDLSVMLRAGLNLHHVAAARRAWTTRRKPDGMTVVDTRYDIDRFLTQKSRRLVDVCHDCRLSVDQPELTGSMTKMQREYLEKQSDAIRERLTILNIRHALSAALVFLLWKRRRRPARRVNVNRILGHALSDHVGYVTERGFQRLLT